jgi:hypothetical protein
MWANEGGEEEEAAYAGLERSPPLVGLGATVSLDLLMATFETSWNLSRHAWKSFLSLLVLLLSSC